MTRTSWSGPRGAALFCASFLGAGFLLSCGSSRTDVGTTSGDSVADAGSRNSALSDPDPGAGKNEASDGADASAPQPDRDDQPSSTPEGALIDAGESNTRNPTVPEAGSPEGEHGGDDTDPNPIGPDIDSPDADVELPTRCESPIVFEDEFLDVLVRWELVESSALFEGDLSAEQVAGIESLSAGVFTQAQAQVQSLEGIQCLTGLSSLNLDDNTGVVDISPLRGLSSLTQLSLRGTSVTDLSPVGALSNLNSLRVSAKGVEDISAIAGLRGLQTLEVTNAAMLDLGALRDLTQLGFLQLSATTLFNLDALEGLGRLTVLRLGSTSPMAIEALAGLTNLTELGLDGVVTPDLTPVQTLSKLTSLSLFGVKTSGNDLQLAPLSQLVGLRFLTITDTPLNSVEALAPLINLETLSLQGNGLVQINGLEQKSALTRLVLDDNRLTDLTPITTLTALRLLSATQNSITDLTPLANTDSSELTLVDLRDNPIDCDAQASNIDRLRQSGINPLLDCL